MNGTFASNVSVAAGAAIGGEGTTSGTLTLVDTASISGVDGLTAGALGTTDAVTGLDLSGVTAGGITVNIDQGGPGVFTVLDYGGTATGFVAGSGASLFTLGTAPAASGRGAGGFADTGTAITYDLGFGTRTWNNFSSDSTWNEGGAGSTNWVEGDTLFFDGDSVIFGDTPGSNQTIALAQNVTPSSVVFTNDATTGYTINDSGGSEELVLNGPLTYSSSVNSTINAIISGTGSITKGDDHDGTSENFVLNLNGANTYSGGTFLTEGRLGVGHNTALGTGTVTLADGIEAQPGNTNQDALLDLEVNNLNIANDFVITNDNGAKQIRLDNGGAAAHNATISGDIQVNETDVNNFILNPGNNDTLTVTGLISGVGGVRVNGNANGTAVLANAANSFTRPLNATNGTLEVATIADSGVASHAGAGNLIRLGLNNANNGVLSYTGAGTSTNRQVQVGTKTGNNTQNLGSTGAGTIDNDGTGALVFTNAAFNTVQGGRIAAEVGSRVLRLGGSYDGSAGANEIQGVIVDNTPTDAFVDETVGITVEGSVWELGGVNTFTGPTIVESGGNIVGHRVDRVRQYSHRRCRGDSGWRWYDQRSDHDLRHSLARHVARNPSVRRRSELRRWFKRRLGVG